jgi:hypothetical protein
MTTETQTPPDWVLLEAAKLSGYKSPMNRAEWLRNRWDFIGGPFRALCDMIQKYEKPPVDRKLACAYEARDSAWAGATTVAIAIRAIELYEEGFGK